MLEIIDKGVLTGNTHYIWKMGGFMLLVAVVQAVFAVIAVYLGARVAMGFGRDVRNALFHRSIALSAREVNEISAPSLITRVTNDVQQVQLLVVMSCTMVLAAPVTIVGGVILALRQDAGLSWLLGVSMPVLAVSLGIIIGRMIPQFRLMQERLDNVNRVLREQITGIRVVRAFVRERQEVQRFEVVNDELTGTSLITGRLMALMFPIVMLVINCANSAVVWFGANRIADGQMHDRFAHRLPHLLHPDPDGGDDGDVRRGAWPPGPRSALSASKRSSTPSRRSSRPSTRSPGCGPPGPSSSATSASPTRAPRPPCSTASPSVPCRARPPRSSAAPGRARRPSSTWSPGSSTPPPAPCWSAGSTCASSTPTSSGTASASCPSGPTSSPGTVASNLRYGKPDATDDRAVGGPRGRRRRRLRYRAWAASTPGSPRAARTSRAASASGSASPGRSSAGPTCTSSTTRSRRSTWPPTPGCGRRSCPYTTGSTVLVVAQRVSTIISADQILVLEDGRAVGLGTHAEPPRELPDLRRDRGLPDGAEDAA